MTVNAKTRYTKDGSRKLKQGGTTSRIPVKKRKEERLRIKKEVAGEKGREAARVLNEQLKVKEEKRLEAVRNKVIETEDPLFDHELFIQDYHRLQIELDKYWKKLFSLGQEERTKEIDAFMDNKESDSPLRLFMDKWQYHKERTPGSKEMNRLMKEYDKYVEEDIKQKKEFKKEKEAEEDERDYRRTIREYELKGDSEYQSLFGYALKI
jgi:hypothetical protein